jgi:hypothetical protein
MIRKNILSAVISVFIMINFNGCCTTIGFIVGTLLDTDITVVRSSSLNKVEKIMPDTPLTIKFKDNESMEGLYQGIARVDSSTYLQRYETFRDGLINKQEFPAIDDIITVAEVPVLKPTEDELEYRFVGFDWDCILLRPVDDSLIKIKDFDEIDFLVDQLGNKIYLQRAKEYMHRGFIPLQSELLILTAEGLQKIPLENVILIEFPNENSAGIWLSLMGFGADVLIGASSGWWGYKR